jgi:hypothetical protein
MQEQWLEKLKDWVREYPCVIVRLERAEWEHLSKSSRGLTEFTMARSHSFFERVRIPTLCFIFGETESFRDRQRLRTEHCLIGRLSSRARISSLETRVKIARALPIWPPTEEDFVDLLGDSIHGRNLRERLSHEGTIIPLSPELSRTLIGGLSAVTENLASLKTVAAGLRTPKTFSSSLALQHDAIHCALRVFGIEPNEGASQLDLSETEESAISSVPVREDTVIQHDARNVPGFLFIRSDITGRAVFERAGGRLEVFTANRLPLEEVFGVDLIYLNLSQRNVVILQYKMLERESKNASEDWIYRPDSNLDAEVARMDRFAAVATKNATGYRLNNDLFYLKFVKRNGLLKNGSILTPLAHFKHILSLPVGKGSKGGVRISYENLAGNYMRTGIFIDLMQAGYIGSHEDDTKNFQSLIKAVVDGKRSVVAALQSPSASRSGFDNAFRSRYGR